MTPAAEPEHDDLDGRDPEREWWDIEIERAPEFAVDLIFARMERRRKGFHVYGGQEY